MSAAEHAIENAVSAIERAIRKATEQGAACDELTEAYKRWKNADPNLEQLDAAPQEIWDMAMWVVYNDRPVQRAKEEQE